MKRVIMLAILACVILAAAYASVRGYTGQVLNREVETLENTLVAHPDITVNRLDYDPGLFRGQLHYDVSVRIPTSHPVLDLIRFVTDNQLPREIRLQGAADVGQGPFLENGQMVLAKVKHDWYLPDDWSTSLPDTTSGPLVTAHARITPDGSITGYLESQDYNGEWVTNNGASLALRLDGLSGDFAVDAPTNTFSLDANVEHFRLGDQGFYGSADALGLIADLDVQDIDQWRSTNRLSAGAMEIASDETGTRLEDVTANIGLTQSGNRVSNYLAIAFGDSLIEYVPLQGGELSVTLEDLDADAYLALAEQLLLSAGGTGSVPDQQATMAALTDLLAAGPVVRIDRISASLREDNDLMGSLRLRYPPDSPVNLQRPTELLQYLETDLSLVATLGALRQVTYLLAEQEARELMRTRGIDRTEEQISRSATTRYRSTLLSLQLLPIVQVADGKAESHLELREGTVYRNGESIMPLGQLLQMFGL